MKIDVRLIGTSVRVYFSGLWAPFNHADYTLDGFDDNGVWITSGYGNQRYLTFPFIDRIEPTP